MKTLIKISFAIILATGVFACKNSNHGAVSNAKTIKFMVYGNCEQCQARIEKALAIEGVAKANWDVDTKILTLVYDSVKLKEADLHHAITTVGHDTEKEKATDKAYTDLPEC